MSNNPIPRPPKVGNSQQVRLERFPQARAVLADLEALEAIGRDFQAAGALMGELADTGRSLLEQARQAFGGTR